VIRRLLCALGLHTWQYLLAPPTWERGDRYDPGIWCIWCSRRGPRGPGDGAVAARPRPLSPDDSLAEAAVPCG